MDERQKTGLALMRKPFEPHQISKLPKPTRAQAEEVKANFKSGIRCGLCGAWHHPNVAHLDYVGHAALTDRLLDCDPEWNWEPVSVNADGSPAIDKDGGMWIRLTVCGVTRLGYGDAAGKSGGDAMKERIGDCLASGTMVTTLRGNVPIENIIIGDVVPTSNGWRQVTDHWLSHKSAPMLTVSFCDGSSITGTPHHRVPTNNGVKLMSELRNGDMLYSFTGDSLCQENEKATHHLKLFGRVEHTAGNLSTKTGIGESILWQLQRLEAIFTGIFGRAIMEHRFHQGGTFTTRTEIRSTTTLITCLPFQGSSIKDFIKSFAFWSGEFARIAVVGLLRYSYVRSGAHQPAKKQAGVRAGLPMSSHINRILRKPESVSSAEQVILRNDSGVSFALLSVVEVSDAGKGSVWNLSVADTHEYVANGILVNNCLRNAAMRFGAALDLWHKGDLHHDEDVGNTEKGEGKPPPTPAPKPEHDPRLADFAALISALDSIEAVNRLVDVAKSYGKPASVAAWKMLKKQAEADGLAWDKESKLFRHPSELINEVSHVEEF